MTTPVHVEHLSSNASLAWPFRAGTSGLVYDTPYTPQATPRVPVDFLVDMVVALPYVGALWYLARIELATSTLVFAGDGVELAFNVPGAVTGYAVLSSANLAAQTTGRLVIHPPTVAALAELKAEHGPSTVLNMGQTLELDAAVLKPLPLKVRSIEPRSDIKTVISDPSGDIGARCVDNVRLVAGYNMDITYLEEVNGIEFSAIPGAGLGRLPCADELLPVTGSTLRPDKNGNLEIESTDCYEVATDRASGNISIRHVCDPCCDCEDYIGVGEQYNRVNRLFMESAARISKLAQAIQGKIECMKDFQVEQAGTCAPGELIVRITASGGNSRGAVRVLLLNKSCDNVVSCHVNLLLTAGFSAATRCHVGWYLCENDIISTQVPGGGAGGYIINTCPDGPCVTIPPGKGFAVLYQFVNLTGVPSAVANVGPNLCSVSTAQGVNYCPRGSGAACPPPTCYADPPFFVTPAGVYDNQVLVIIQSPEVTASIYYTLDGGEPTTWSTPYTGPILITATTVVKARAYAGGCVPSDIRTATYRIRTT